MRFEQVPQESIFEGLPETAVIVTVNRRLSRRLRKSEKLFHKEAGETAWHPADILPYDAWIKRFFTDQWRYCTSGRLPSKILSAQAELFVWESILKKEAQDIAETRVTAKSVKEAFDLCLEYMVDPGSLDSGSLPEHRAFARWYELFSRYTAESGWIPAASLTSLVAEAIEQRNLSFSGPVFLVGFDDITPCKELLFSTMNKRGIHVFQAVCRKEKPEKHRLEFPGRDDEIRAAATFARMMYESGKRERTGVVFTDLAGIRERAERIFHEVFYPGELLVPRLTREKDFNISAAPALGQTPAVSLLCRLLSGMISGFSTSELCELVRHPCLKGAAGETEGRACFDVWIRNCRRKDWSLSDAARAADLFNEQNSGIGILARILAWCNETAALLSTRQSPAKWAELFSKIFWKTIAGDEESNDSDTYQLCCAVENLLYEFSGIGQQSETMGLGRAVDVFTGMAQDTLFQPEGNESAMEVCGILEAAGQQFDILWIGGMHADAWPPPPRPNPFIPLSIQKEKKMPHSSFNRELEFCRKIIERIEGSCKRIIYSHHLFEGDAMLEPSPFIRDIPKQEAASLLAYPPADRVKALCDAFLGRIESVSVDNAPRIESGEDIKGGTSILADQAVCPFRAFALHRLHAEALETPSVWPDFADRGTIVHQVLARFWRETKTRKRLEGMLSSARLEKYVSGLVQEAVTGFARFCPALAGGRFARLEAERITALLVKWLEHECGRPDFNVVHVETDIEAVVGGLLISGKCDRLDYIDGKGYAIIDYKTGQADYREWFASRFLSPQLPFYAVNMEKPVSAVLFAHIDPGSMRFSGVAADVSIVPGNVFDVTRLREGPGHAAMDELKREWEELIAGLARDFTGGNATISPADPKVCRNCVVKPVCRIKEIEYMQ